MTETKHDANKINRIRVSNSRKIRVFSEVVDEMNELGILNDKEVMRLNSVRDKYKTQINEPLKQKEKKIHVAEKRKECASRECDRKVKVNMKYCSSVCSPFATIYPEDDF